MHDDLGVETQPGDWIAFKKPYSTHLSAGIVVNFTGGRNPRVLIWNRRGGRFEQKPKAITNGYVKIAAPTEATP